jgi:hypothetical protein
MATGDGHCQAYHHHASQNDERACALAASEVSQHCSTPNRFAARISAILCVADGRKASLIWVKRGGEICLKAAMFAPGPGGGKRRSPIADGFGWACLGSGQAAA